MFNIFKKSPVKKVIAVEFEPAQIPQKLLSMSTIDYSKFTSKQFVSLVKSNLALKGFIYLLENNESFVEKTKQNIVALLAYQLIKQTKTYVGDVLRDEFDTVAQHNLFTKLNLLDCLSDDVVSKVLRKENFHFMFLEFLKTFKLEKETIEEQVRIYYEYIDSLSVWLSSSYLTEYMRFISDVRHYNLNNKTQLSNYKKVLDCIANYDNWN